MLRIRYNDLGKSIHENCSDPVGFPYRTERSASFHGAGFSSHFGTRNYDFLLKSYLFPLEDRLVTAIVLTIHENRADLEFELREEALDAEAREAEIAARRDRRLNRKGRKKKRGRQPRGNR